MSLDKPVIVLRRKLTEAQSTKIVYAYVRGQLGYVITGFGDTICPENAYMKPMSEFVEYTEKSARKWFSQEVLFEGFYYKKVIRIRAGIRDTDQLSGESLSD